MTSASDTAILHTIASYEAGIATLRSAAAGLTHAQLNTRIAPGTWSIQEIIAHILDSDLIATHRMRRIAAEDLPLLVSYDENLFIANLTTALDLFDANRRFTAQWLRTLTPDAFAREGIHTQRGKVTLKNLLEIYTKHVDHHQSFVQGKRAAMGVR